MGSVTVKWWVDGLFVVHLDIQNQSGVAMSIGRGSIYNNSTKQNLIL